MVTLNGRTRKNTPLKNLQLAVGKLLKTRHFAAKTSYGHYSDNRLVGS